MPIAPELARILQPMAAAQRLDLAALPLEAALAHVRPPRRFPPPAEDDGLAVEDHALGAARGVRVRAYRPADAGAPLPMVIHAHGGGFVGGSVEGDDARCRILARAAGVMVVSVGYRLAPEHPHPAAIEDVEAAVLWASAQAARLGGDPGRLALSGFSAGGFLAIAAALRLARRGRPVLRAISLAYPVIDPGQDSATYALYGDGPFLTRSRMRWYWNCYLGADPTGADPELHPLRAGLSGLPPALVITAENDVLRGEAEAFARRLAEAGVPVELSDYPGMVHGFPAVAPAHPATRAALAQMAAFLRRRLHG